MYACCMHNHYFIVVETKIWNFEGRGRQKALTLLYQGYRTNHGTHQKKFAAGPMRNWTDDLPCTRRTHCYWATSVLHRHVARAFIYSYNRPTDAAAKMLRYWLLVAAGFSHVLVICMVICSRQNWLICKWILSQEQYFLPENLPFLLFDPRRQ
jgi:hypothetical protein